MELITEQRGLSALQCTNGQHAPVTGQGKQENHLFPVFLKAENLRLLLVGGGAVALEKLCAVLRNAPEAAIKIVALHISVELRLKASLYPNIHLQERAFRPADLQDTDWVIVAVNNKEVSGQIRRQSRAAGILVNVADAPDLCDFYLGSIVGKGSLKIGISTNGKSPTIAKRIKEMFQSVIPDELEDVLHKMQEIRERLNGDFASRVEKLNNITQVFIDQDSAPAC